MKKSKFKGYDYTELGETWGLFKTLNNDELKNFDIKIITNYLTLFALPSTFLNIPGREGTQKTILVSQKTIAEDIKAYLKAMLRGECGYWTPVWEGMIKVEDDYTLIHATIALLPHMWT